MFEHVSACCSVGNAAALPRQERHEHRRAARPTRRARARRRDARRQQRQLRRAASAPATRCRAVAARTRAAAGATIARSAAARALQPELARARTRAAPGRTRASRSAWYIIARSVEVDPVLLRRPAAPAPVRRTACPAADTTPRCRCRPARSGAPCPASARCRQASRRDSRTAGRSRPRCPPRAAASAARSICSTRVPFSIASSTRCEPDSAPIQTVRQPDAVSARDHGSRRRRRPASGT